MKLSPLKNAIEGFRRKPIHHGPCPKTPRIAGYIDSNMPGLITYNKKKVEKPRVEAYYKFPGANGFCSKSANDNGLVN